MCDLIPTLGVGKCKVYFLMLILPPEPEPEAAYEARCEFGTSDLAHYCAINLTSWIRGWTPERTDSTYAIAIIANVSACNRQRATVVSTVWCSTNCLFLITQEQFDRRGCSIIVPFLTWPTYRDTA
jgi:hypothetical protein